ncbi:hypothetical protein [Streptomyces sp. SAS_270]|uniref:hypothetical protein n=1 Tax=Streptomyces sp. SAS_270 TaxID=3412748 RepID=UPI00403CCD7A
MHPHVPPNLPDRPLASSPACDAAQLRGIAALRESVHRAQRAFLVVNGVPFIIGSALSCFTDVPAVQVSGKLTLGIVWGILQCALFVATAWWFENRSTRSSDSLEQALPSSAAHTGMSVAASVNRSGW